MLCPALPPRVRQLTESSPRSCRRLQALPILGPSHDQPAYRLFDEAAEESVRITEVDEDGDVPWLTVENTLADYLYLMDGQELVGAKQNRILNTDVLVPPHGTVRLPVSCVEYGRWGYLDRLFRPGGSASHRVRSGKLRRVSESLREQRGHDADQDQVWSEVDSSLTSAQVDSTTDSLHDAYLAHADALADYRRNLELPDDAVGVAVHDQGELLGIDLFDRASTLQSFWGMLIDSYAIELVGGGESPDSAHKAPTRSAHGVLAEVAERAWSAHDSPGEGRDWRLEDAGYAGAALVWDEAVVIHAQLIPTQCTA